MKVIIISLIFCVQFLGLLLASKPKVVCYWPNYTDHKPNEIDATLCTHIHYAFFAMDEVNNVIKDKLGQVQPDKYNGLLALKQKNKDLKIVASLGGWGEPDIKFSHMVNNPNLRKKFIENTLNILKQYHFDGFDIDWEYPVCWAGDCSKGPKSDHENFGKLIKEFREVFDKQNPRLSLSAAVVAGARIADQAYDYQAIAQSLDYVNVMTYAMWPVSEGKTGHHSKYTVSIEAVEYYVSKGIPKEKVLLGVSFYGRSFKLADASKHFVGAPIAGDGDVKGDYWNVCELIKHTGWTKEQSDNGHDPIAYKGLQWIGYDDIYAAYDKSNWVKENGYGGVIVWEITQDDTSKKCCAVHYPLLKAVNHGLFGTGQALATYGCEHK